MRSAASPLLALLRMAAAVDDSCGTIRGELWNAISGPTFSFSSASLTGRETALEGAGVVVSGILGNLCRSELER